MVSFSLTVNMETCRACIAQTKLSTEHPDRRTISENLLSLSLAEGESQGRVRSSDMYFRCLGFSNQIAMEVGKASITSIEPLFVEPS